MWKIFIVIYVLVESHGLVCADYEPVILEPRKTYTAQLNGTVCLKCQLKTQYVNNSQKILVYWTKDGIVLRKARDSRFQVLANVCLQIKNLQSSDHGNYSCHAVNRYGTAHALRVLVVSNRKRNDGTTTTNKNGTNARKWHPMFDDQLKVLEKIKYQRIRVGNKAKFKCAIEATSPPLVKWYYNGNLIQPSDGVIIRARKKKNLLIISRFAKDDVGKYTCVATNGKKTVNMSFIVDVYEPLVFQKQKFNWVLKPGDNVTLPCALAADKVEYIHWSRQINNRHDLQKDVNRSSRSFQLSQQQHIVNGTIVNDYILLNVSERMHAGTYTCQAGFYGDKVLTDVKVYHLSFGTDEITPVGIEKKPASLLTVAISVSGGALSIIIILFCVRCRRKQAKHLSRAEQSKYDGRADDEEETMSLKILPEYPTGSLTIHRKSTEDSNDNIYTTIKNTIEFTELGTLETKIVQSPQVYQSDSNCDPNNLSRNSSSIETTAAENRIDGIFCNENLKGCAKNTWPGQRLLPGDPEYEGLGEEDRLIPRKKRPCENSDIYTKRKDNTNERTKNPIHHSHCGVLDDDIPPLIISHSPPEEEDKLLQREMKMWEPLIKTSNNSSTNNDINDVRTSSKILSPRCDEFPPSNSKHTNHLVL